MKFNKESNLIKYLSMPLEIKIFKITLIKHFWHFVRLKIIQKQFHQGDFKETPTHEKLVLSLISEDIFPEY